MEGVRPKKPEGQDTKHLEFSDELWRTVEQCWSKDRNARPRVGDILACLNDASRVPDTEDEPLQRGKPFPEIGRGVDEIERDVDEMDKVGISTSPAPLHD